MYNILYINGMNDKNFQILKIMVAAFLIILVLLAVVRGQVLLALLAVVAGILFLTAIRSKSEVIMDEREQSVQEKAARMTYMIFAPTLGLSALALLLLSTEDNFYLESLGIIFSYLTLFQITLYTLSSFFIDRKYGGDGQEE